MVNIVGGTILILFLSLTLGVPLLAFGEGGIATPNEECLGRVVAICSIYLFVLGIKSRKTGMGKSLIIVSILQWFVVGFTGVLTANFT